MDQTASWEKKERAFLGLAHCGDRPGRDGMPLAVDVAQDDEPAHPLSFRQATVLQHRSSSSAAASPVKRGLEHDYTTWTINLEAPTPEFACMQDACAILGRNLRILRHQRKLTQEDLQAATGVSQQYLSELENGGRNPSLRMLARLADALGVQAFELLHPEPPFAC